MKTTNFKAMKLINPYFPEAEFQRHPAAHVKQYSTLQSARIFFLFLEHIHWTHLWNPKAKNGQSVKGEQRIDRHQRGRGEKKKKKKRNRKDNGKNQQ